MDVCRACGHHVDVGRFCLNCGTPIDGDFHPDLTPGTTSHREADRTRFAWLPVLVIGLVLLVAAAGMGAWLLRGASGDDSAAPVAEPIATPSEPEATRTPDAGEVPDEDQGEDPGTDDNEEPQDLIRFAVPDVPDTASPSRDTSGNLVRFAAANMIDELPDTAWRMPGDATGREVVLTFPARARLTRIGLINGYAKSTDEFDWYAGNRRIRSVTWTFDDGTAVSQDLADEPVMQSIEIDPVATTTVTITLDTVSAPGEGRASRDFTAISDVLLFGTPA